MKNLLLLFLLLVTSTLFSQKKETFVIPDSLKKMSFKILEDHFDKSIMNEKKLNIYAKTYYKKSKWQDDEIIKAKGMYMLAYISREDSLFRLTDSIIALTKKRNDFIFPAKAYILRSIISFSDGQFNKALVDILNAEGYSDKSGNIEQKILINQQIGLIKIELGKPQEALPLIIENYNYYKNKNPDSPYYVYSAWILSNIYNRLNKPDLALHYIELFLSKMKEQDPYYKYFMLNKGISYHFKKNFSLSNKTLDEAIILLKTDKINQAIAYYYRGENVLQGEKSDFKSKKYFEKVDSILITTHEFTAILRNSYLHLIEIYRKLKDNSKQLYYLNRLNEIDEKLNKNNIVLSDNMNQKYDTPHLLLQKEKIISEMNKEQKIYIGIVLVVFMGLIFALLYLSKIRKEKIMAEEKFQIIINQSQSKIESTDVIIGKNKTKSLDLPISIANDLLQKLNTFEKNMGYLELNLKLSDLSIRFETNSSYLSKTINQYKNKNFSQYLNDLRIAYAIKRLKSENKFQKYTIKAIAEEVGFSNSESFAKAFFNNTGLQPSYFIKKLMKQYNFILL
ncbi:AraC family transcriptional regulator [Flavobacterium piscis]|uniref:AraC-like DNA-binding protein n=1 Tax=Flavobacterium piscis TaxID=1114874 RepID=A0ABU1Y532_9FLAO|nr:AraC family transcriptional regulator [Flavobacterium piscis]MDR7209337.1 AraC-like DNA-binding protein [Flavobacterium piscis]